MSSSVIRVLFFASLRDAVGVSECAVSVDEPLSFERLMAELRNELSVPAYEAICAEHVRVAINQELVDAVGSIGPGDEVAFLPPVTGG